MVEHLLAKEGVEGSNPFFRSNVNSIRTLGDCGPSNPFHP